MRSLIVLLISMSASAIQAQSFLKYAGKYEANGFTVQIALYEGALVLVVPGAPLQELESVGGDRFKSAAYDDSFFLFVEGEGKVIAMISESPGNSMELKKLSDVADPINVGDSLLSLTKSTDHFTFLYSDADSTTVGHIASQLETSYHKILTDFKMKEIPVTTVRIYPTLKSFHAGINFPDAPSNVLATAFGKNDIRMTSPYSVGKEDSMMLTSFMVHEFVHCVHLNIDYAPNNPRWLWEGIAMYESGWFVDPREIELVQRKELPPLASLSDGLEYELGYVIIEAIREAWNFDAVMELIRKRGDTQAVLQISQEEFEKRLYAHIYAKYARK